MGKTEGCSEHECEAVLHTLLHQAKPEFRKAAQMSSGMGPACALPVPCYARLVSRGSFRERLDSTAAQMKRDEGMELQGG